MVVLVVVVVEAVTGRLVSEKLDVGEKRSKIALPQTAPSASCMRMV